MKKTIIGSLAAGALLALTAFSAQAEDKVYKLGMDQTDYPPFATKDTSGKWTGWEVELGLAVCEAAKIKCELFPTAWDGIIPALQEGKIDFILPSMTINADRQKQVDFTHFYYDTQTVIVGNKADTTKIDFDNPDSVKGKVFGAQNATIHSKFLQSRFSKTAEIKTYDGLDTALADLGAGRVDYVQESYLTIEPFLKTDAGKDFEKKADVPDDPIMGEGVGAAVRKDDKDTLDKLNAALKTVWDNGTYKKLEEKYGLTGKLKEPSDL